MAAGNERRELARLCSSKDWSKAIRILDNLLARSCSIQDLCNRAFCYSQLELHKHVIKDCDKASQLDPNLLQAYILKGHALSALGRKEEAVLVWEQGYGIAICQSADLKQLLELEELLASAKQNKTVICEDYVVDSCAIPSASDFTSTADSSAVSSPSDSSPVETSSTISSSSDTSPVELSSTVTSVSHDSPVKKNRSNGTNGTNYKSGSLSEICSMLNDSIKFSRNVLVTGLPKNKSISLDFRLSRGIAQLDHIFEVLKRAVNFMKTVPSRRS